MAALQIGVLFAVAVLLSGHPQMEPSPGRRSTCKDGMEMVKKYLEESKVELINNIKQAKSHQCKMQAWRKVDKSMVANTYSAGLKATLDSDETGGLKIKAEVTDHGCGGKGSALVVHIKGDWQQIMYTQVFTGSASCWGIFGNDYNNAALKTKVNSGLEVFNPTLGDIIYGQKGMKSKTDNVFDGKSKRCDNLQHNFWHQLNGNGERRATVVLRRKKGAKDAGVQTGTSCGTPKYEIKDIYVLL